MNKRERYKTLVAKRKSFDPTPFGLLNPSCPELTQFDSDEIGPWTRWANDLDADLMIVGQDWGDDTYYKKNRGADLKGNPTNVALQELLRFVGRPISAPPSVGEHSDNSGVWLTNALLWLKRGGMSSPVRSAWFKEPAAEFLREQIEIVQPRVIVGLGAWAYKAVGFAFGAKLVTAPFRTVVEDKKGVLLPMPLECRLFGVYHCGARVSRLVRSSDQQREDWRKIRSALESGKGPT